jgi:hypothetical protein
LQLLQPSSGGGSGGNHAGIGEHMTKAQLETEIEAALTDAVDDAILAIETALVGNGFVAHEHVPDTAEAEQEFKAKLQALFLAAALKSKQPKRRKATA